MELFDLPMTLLVAITSCLDLEALVWLDSAVCNRKAQPTMLDVFVRCRIPMDSICHLGK